MNDLSPTPSMALARELAGQFSRFAQVQAVAVAGSQASGRADASSDIDLYIYTRALIPLEARRAIVAARGASRADLNLHFWDLGDEWVDLPSGIEVDVIYWDAPWIEAQLARVLDQHQPGMGYTTSFWHTLRKSQILFDRAGWFQSLQARAAQPYPEPLREAIIAINHAVLRRVIPSYTHQLELAVRRADLISVNHRLAALLASYFDVVYALNRELHPGEKRLLEQTAARCPRRPAGMEEDIPALLRGAGAPDDGWLARLHGLLDRLDQLLAAEGFDPSTSRPRD